MKTLTKRFNSVKIKAICTIFIVTVWFGVSESAEFAFSQPCGQGAQNVAECFEVCEFCLTACCASGCMDAFDNPWERPDFEWSLPNRQQDRLIAELKTELADPAISNEYILAKIALVIGYNKGFPNAYRWLEEFFPDNHEAQEWFNSLTRIE